MHEDRTSLIVLRVQEGESRSLCFELDQALFTLGRLDTNEVVLPDYHLSGEHGQIFREGEEYIYRDLRSTNGSSVIRGGERVEVGAERSWEIALRDGDALCLGDPRAPVVLSVRIAGSARGESERGDRGREQGGPEAQREAEGEDDGDPGEQLIASRSIRDLPAVTDRVEGDPASALRIYKALSPLSARLEMDATLEAVVEAALELLPHATHVSILLRSESDKDRFSVGLARERVERPESSRQPSHSEITAEPGEDPVRASRSVLRRVLADRAAVLTANAQEEMASSASILGGRIRSVLAVPLWRGEEITGLIQIDNRSSARMFTEADLEMALLLGAQAALAVDNAALVSRLRVAEERLRGENRYLKEREERLRFEGMIGDSPAMQRVLGQLKKVLDTPATICIQGETGTGKELVASAVHYQSARRDKMFVAQNCAALPESLLESELFGHKRGAFTGAESEKKGLFEIADGGTLFLDEIGDMPPPLQTKLLRVLQEGTIRPVGATRERSVDVRIICATNRDLAAEVDKGNFRQDLYYRLMVFPIRLPPLRERREDIPALAEHFLRRYSREYNCDVAGFSQQTLDALASYHWPGNIRELENEIQRLVIQAEPDSWLDPTDLSPHLREVEAPAARLAPERGTLKDMLEQVERSLLSEALREHGGNKTRTAQALGITREGLHKKLSKFGL